MDMVFYSIYIIKGKTHKDQRPFLLGASVRGNIHLMMKRTHSPRL